jgi:tetratricopeptide (TPR) repeat protein
MHVRLAIIALVAALAPSRLAVSQDVEMEPVVIDGVTVPPFAGDIAACDRRRLQLGLVDGAAVLASSLSDAALIDAIEALIAEGYGEAERWLFAMAAYDGQIEVAAWRMWDAALQTTDLAQRRAQMVRALHFTSGNPAALLPAECWSGDELLIASLEPARRAIMALGAGRLRSAFDGVVAGADGADAPTRAALDALDGRLDAAVAPGTPGCSPALVATIALAAGDSQPFEASLPLVSAAIRAGLVPQAQVRRIAVHRYLLEDAASLDELNAAIGADRPDWTIQAMVAGLARDGARMAELAQGRPGSDAVEEFMRAESLRLSGHYDEALPLYDQMVEQDGLFAAAVFGRASTLIALDREDDALADLEHARLAFSTAPIYGRWVEALGARLTQ